MHMCMYMYIHMRLSHDAFVGLFCSASLTIVLTDAVLMMQKKNTGGGEDTLAFTHPNPHTYTHTNSHPLSHTHFHTHTHTHARTHTHTCKRPHFTLRTIQESL